MDHDFSTSVDSIEKVPADFRPLYAQGTDGKFAVNPTFAPIVASITGFSKAASASRRDADEAKKRVVDLTPLVEFGADPVAIKAEFDKRVSELTAKGGDAAKAVDQVRKEMKTASDAAVLVERNRSNAYQAQLHTLLVKNDALASIAEAKGMADLLMPFIENQVKVVEADGKMEVHVIDGKGERRYSGTTGQPMTIKELVATMKADAKYGRLFESEQQQGGGGMGPGNGSRRQQQQGAGDLTANQKIAAGLSKAFTPGGGRRP